MRLSAGLFVGGAACATITAVLNAFVINKQFYPSIVYLSKSSSSMAVLYVQALVFVYIAFEVLRKILFGDLRASEHEHLSERTWHAILETCLAFTVFRDDFSPKFVAQFIGLLFIKSFHWLAEDRVDMMERSPVITMKFHIRMLAVLGGLGAVDSFFASHAFFSTVSQGAGSQIVFGFEYAILITIIMHAAVKYLLHVVDLHRVQAWDNKAVIILYTELVINFIRFALYGVFAMIMLKVHTFPLFAVRPFYQSLRTFAKACKDVVMSRRAITAMNNQFPVVTAAELETMDSTCIICREEMTAVSSPKRLPCSHVFHTHCLRSWFQRQQTCPTCRTEIWTTNNQNQDTRPNVPAGQAEGPNVNAIPGIPFVAHQFAFQIPNNVAAGAAGGLPNQAHPGPFPHQIFFAPPPVNRPEFMNLQQGPMPFGLPPFIPSPPPPFASPIPPDYSGFTDQELRNMEGDSRDAIIARLRAMDNVMTLIDSANIQMTQLAALLPQRSQPAAQQQNASAETSATPEPLSTNLNEQETSNQAPGHTSSIESRISAPDLPTSSGNVSPSTSTAHSNESTPVFPTNESPSLFRRKSGSTNVSSFNTASTSSGSTTNLEELRQRRLARFAANDSSQSQSNQPTRSPSP